MSQSLSDKATDKRSISRGNPEVKKGSEVF